MCFLSHRPDMIIAGRMMPAASNPTPITVVRDRTTFAQQGAAWDALASRFGNPLLSHDWFVSCSEAFGGDLHVVEAWRDGRLVAAAPLVASAAQSSGRLEFLGAAALYEPCTLLYEDEAALHDLCKGLVDLSRPLLLQRIPTAIPVHTALRTAGGGGWWTTQDGGDCPYSALPQTWNDYLGTRSAQRRYDLRRARRRMEARGRAGFRFLTPTESELDALLERAFAIEASGWKGRGGSAIALRPAMRNFLVRYARRACRTGLLRICFLDLDSDPVAVEIAVQAHDRFWVLKIGYDERWAQCSPGLQLLTECVRESIASGCVGQEFLGSGYIVVIPLETIYKSGVQPGWDELFGSNRASWIIIIYNALLIDCHGQGLAHFLVVKRLNGILKAQVEDVEPNPRSQFKRGVG